MLSKASEERKKTDEAKRTELRFWTAGWVRYSFPIAAIAKYFTSRGLTQKKRTPSQFWRGEVWNQGISRATLCLEALGENLSSPPPAAGGSSFPWLVSAPTQSLPPWSGGLLPCVPVFCTSVSYKNTCHLIWSWLDNPGWSYLKILPLITSATLCIIKLAAGGGDICTTTPSKHCKSGLSPNLLWNRREGSRLTIRSLCNFDLSQLLLLLLISLMLRYM